MSRSCVNLWAGLTAHKTRFPGGRALQIRAYLAETKKPWTTDIWNYKEDRLGEIPC
jgi:hypothetical protein